MSKQCPWCKDSPDLPLAQSWVMAVDREWPATQAHSSARLANGGAARFMYKRIRDAWAGDIRWAVDLAEVPRADARRRVTLVRLWGRGQRERDRDNLIAGGKPIVDGLVAAGVIIDDRRKHAVIHYDQRKSDDGVSRVLIRIDEFA